MYLRCRVRTNNIDYLGMAMMDFVLRSPLVWLDPHDLGSRLSHQSEGQTDVLLRITKDHFSFEEI